MFCVSVPLWQKLTMKIAELGEFGLIRKIQKISSRKSSFTLVGIGDDAAALKVLPSRTLLATTDMLLEGVHFDLSFTDFYSLGWKSAAVNLSDIAAMGGVPRACLTSIGIPSRVSAELIAKFYRGFEDLIDIHKASLVGGDTCRSRNGIIVSVTVLGDVEKSRLLTRSGTKPGDRLFVTGTLGDSAAGLEMLKKGVRRQGSGVRRLIQKHLRPVPRVKEGRALALSGCASAMIDISDGLSSDLNHICEQSAVGAEISADRIPLSPSLSSFSTGLTRPALTYALSGGEDYELLFTVPPAKLKRLQSLRIQITEIGTITGARGLYLTSRSGERKKIRPSGYDHFDLQHTGLKDAAKGY